jgi:predicted enzyme related to lactoylglutathione lyase
MSATLTAVLPGRFVWHELLTTDPAAAKAFYSAVIGWGTQPFDPEGTYTLWTAGEQPVGGVMAFPEEAKQGGAAHPAWLTYISTPDTDATAKRVVELGGKIRKAPDNIPNVGRFAVLTDPQGAYFCLYTPESPAPDAQPTEGQFSWHELATTDHEAAFKFYTTLFPWVHTSTMDMGPSGPYVMYGVQADVPLGGMYNKPPETPVPNWLPYALVPDADAAAEKATKLGGTILVGPMEVPGGDRIAVAMDPQGAVFAVHSRKK